MRSKPRTVRASRAVTTAAAAVLAVGMLTSCGTESDEGTATGDTVETVTTGPRPRVGAAAGVVEATYTYVIPPGAGATMAAGVELNILPGSLDALVGQSIRIVNEDRQGHTVGPWYVGPNETLTQKFTSAGVYEGQCTVHSSGAFILDVRDA